MNKLFAIGTKSDERHIIWNCDVKWLHRVDKKLLINISKIKWRFVNKEKKFV